MFIYTSDSILNVDNMLGLSINFMRGAKLTCPAIFLNQVNGKSVVLIQCNTTSDCCMVLDEIKEHINRNKNYTVPNFDLETVRVRIKIPSGIHTFFVPKYEPTVLLNRLKIDQDHEGAFAIMFDNSPLGFVTNSGTGAEVLARLQEYLEGDIHSDDPPFDVECF